MTALFATFAAMCCVVMGAAILNSLTICDHKHVAWPQRNKQRCLDCGRERFYRFGGNHSEWRAERRMA